VTIYRTTISPACWTLWGKSNIEGTVFKNAADNTWTEGRELKAKENPS
jgi:hypothetical protein